MVGLSNLLYGQYVTKIKRNLNNIDMTFFARPDLSNEQFKQLEGSILSLSGTTHIINVSGLTLTNGAGIPITITAEGAGVIGDTKDGYSLVYNHYAGRIELQDISGGTGIMSCTGATTCAVGGIGVGSIVSGFTFEEVFNEMLFPTTSGVTTQLPFHTLATTGDTMYEVGTGVTYTSMIRFYRGCHTPTYEAGTGNLISAGTPLASNTPYIYCFNSITLPTHSETTSNLTSTTGFTFPMPQGNVSWCTRVTYPEGANLYDSKGVLVSTFSSGITTPVSKTISGIFPYYWGRISSGLQAIGCNRPEINTVRDCINALNAVSGVSLNNTCKVVASSSSTIGINFSSTADDYIWFAIPSGSTSKTCWYVNALNQGTIGGTVSAGGNLFPDEVSTVVTSEVWSNANPSLFDQTYKVYISNYQSAAAQPMQLCN